MTDLTALSARLRAGTVTPADLDAAADALSDGPFYQEKDIDAMQSRIKHLETAGARENDEICQTLGKALGYPWFKDDQANFPGADKSHGVCVGEHVAVTIADEAARRIAALEAENARLRTPDLFWDDDGYGFEDWKDLLDQSFDLDHVAKVLCGRSIPIKWAANECVSLDDDGDPDEIVPRLFDTPEEAARCWPDSLNRLRAALPQPPEADNG